MTFFTLEPEVAGGWGARTEFTRTLGQPLLVHKLHYQFDGWLGDELLESSPCFIVTQKVSEAIRDSGLDGVGFAEVEVTLSEEFVELYPELVLPHFIWMKVFGKPKVNAFGLDSNSRLVVSELALQVLKAGTLDNCEVLLYCE